jgi:hypothetical protein
MTAGLFIVEFVGGPFDGKTISMSQPPTPGRVVIPVAAPPGNELGNGGHAPSRRVGSLAAYDLQEHHEGWIYRFCGTLPTNKPAHGRLDRDLVERIVGDERDRFAQTLGFASRTALFEASLFVAASDGRKWYVTVDDRGSWWSWNDSDMQTYKKTSSLDDAVRWVRRMVEMPAR